MIRIRYSAETQAIELEGSSQELLELRNSIQKFTSHHLFIETEANCDPSPYDVCLNGIIFHETTLPLLCISVQSTKLNVSGSRESLVLFSENLPCDAIGQYHVHLDRIGREEMIAEDSLEIVLALKSVELEVK
jgi:hypothetical protein